ncbi:MAG: hypothetical protein NTX87_16065, partial [Planctomycetota bacterium]|nr:hypothetical protein [Planctomycetota bacterium]
MIARRGTQLQQGLKANGLGAAVPRFESLEARLLLSTDTWGATLPDALARPNDLGGPSASDLTDPVAPGESPPPSGLAPYGANSQDGSEYMVGDVWLTLVLLESNGSIDPQTENWTTSEISQVKSEVREGLTWWENTFHSYPSVAPRHDLRFFIDYTYADTPVQTGYEPINRGAMSDQTRWIDNFLNQVGYNSPSDSWTDLEHWNHDQRLVHETHWAYTAFVVDSSADTDGMFSDGYFAYAYIGGPFTVLTYDNDGWGIGNLGQVLAHETGHIFYALDEYPGSNKYTDHSGYYNTQNLNASDGNPSPATRVNSIMAEADKQNAAYSAHVTSPTSSYMIGWQDTDRDGLFDVLDVPLTLTGSGSYNSATNQFEFSGGSTVGTLANQNPYGTRHNITTNTVDHIQYRLDNGSWVAGNAYGQYTPAVAQNVTVTAAGAHTIDFRTIFDETGITSNVLTYNFNITATVAVSVSPSSVLEDGTPNLVYTFSRSGPTTSALTVSFSVGGTATYNTDYTQSGAASFSATSGTVTILAGSATATVTINPTADTTVEPDETAILTVTSGTGYTPSGSPATGTIANDDIALAIAATDATKPEGNTGSSPSTAFTFTVTRTGLTTGSTTVNYAVTGSG